jgi:hypothetical protein
MRGSDAAQNSREGDATAIATRGSDAAQKSREGVATAIAMRGSDAAQESRAGDATDIAMRGSDAAQESREGDATAISISEDIEMTLRGMMPPPGAMPAPAAPQPAQHSFSSRQIAEVDAGYDAMKQAMEANFCDLRKAAGGRFKRYMEKHPAFAQEYQLQKNAARNEFRMKWVKDCVPQSESE